MWGFSGIPEQINWLSFEPVRILDEFDVPGIFVCKDVPGNTYLAYLCGEDRQGVRYLVVPCSAETERTLVTGQINLRDALTKNRAWIFDLDNRWQPVRAWKVDVDNLPDNALPRPGVMLYAYLRPVINIMKSRPWANQIEMEYAPDSNRPMQHGILTYA